MTLKEICDAINNGEYWSIYDTEDELPLGSCLAVIDYYVDEWDVVATSIYKQEDGLLGIRGVAYIFGNTWASDLDVKCRAFPVKEIPSITYEEIK